MSPGGQTLLLSWCLFSAACADSPAEEEGKRSNKRAEEKREGIRGRKTDKKKIKLIKFLKVWDKQKRQEWFAKRKDDIQGLGSMSLTGLPLQKWGWSA